MQYNTQLLNAENKDDIQTTARLLKSGELVAVPTETVYGLAADAKNPEAVKKIFIAKNRPADHPLIVHISSAEKLNQWAEDISPLAWRLAEAFWPGPLTLLLKKRADVNDVVTGGLSTIALRVPQNKTLLTLLDLLDTGLAAPSANPHKRISPTTAEHVMSGLAGKIAAVLDGGPCSVGLESTIVDLTGTAPRILRPGPITKDMLEKAIKTEVIIEKKHGERVAGNMNVHYQPHTHTKLMTLDEIKAYIASADRLNKKIGIMHYSGFDSCNPSIYTKKISDDKSEYARLMYKTMHDLDVLGLDIILIEAPPHISEWMDVVDRLSKATTKE